MSEQPKSSWDNLAEQIGATPESADKPSTAPASTSPASSTPPPAQTADYAEPTRPASGWDSLLGEFGIDAPAAAPVSPPAPAAKAQAAPPKQKTVPADQGDEEVGATDEAGSERLAFRKTNEPHQSAEIPTNALDQSEDEQGDTPTFEEDPVAQQEETEQPHDQSAEVAEAESQAEESVAAAKPKAVEPPPSKWDLAPKGQLTLPDWFPFAGKRSKTPVAPPVDEEATSEAEPPAEESAPAETARAKDAAIESLDENDREQAFEEGDASEGQEDAGGESTDESTGERTGRRRRRRGRRRRSSATTPPETATTAEEEAAEAVDESAAALRDAGPQELAASSESASSEAADDDDSDDSDDSDDGPTGGKHRNVPSWSDALAVVIDANIAARSDRKKFTVRGSGNNNGRGRRGGRRRKKSPN